jgi:dsRNA-specific ribonuclease
MATMNNAIYFGDRGTDFHNLIQGLLIRGNLKPKYIDLLTTTESMETYGAAFTSATANTNHNYEVFEQLGDLSANKFIVWYMYRRFPQLNCKLGVKVAARLRINYGAKKSFSKIASDLGFWKFISASEEERSCKMKPLLEDTLEAFIGATEYLLDAKLRNGVGYAIVYDILKNIFDKINISLEYNDLYDPKTRLKELFDYHPTKLGTLQYYDIKSDMLTTSIVYNVKSKNQRYKIGEGVAALKADAQQKAATMALENLKYYGFSKEIPVEYSLFCQ